MIQARIASRVNRITGNLSGLFFVLFLWGYSFGKLQAQNVGIGTLTPTNRLHVYSDATVAMKVESGNSSVELSLNTSAGFRGSLGAISGTFGLRSNAAVPIVFSPGFNPRVNIQTNGNVGIGDFVPQERLDLLNGNIKLTNSPKGIILNGADAPFITRGWDPFTSGANAGLGRWGIFMEPSRLTFGIPNLSGKKFQFASYDANGNRNPILEIDYDGKLQRQAGGTGNVDMLPVAYGNISWGGYVLSGTPNITVTTITSGSVYDIGIAGKTLAINNTVFSLTVTNDGQGSVNYWGFFLDGKIRVVLSRSSPGYNRDFSIIIYQP